MNPDTWWYVRSSAGYVSAATYRRRKGLVVSWEEDPRDALDLPTSRSAWRLYRAIDSALVEGLRVVRVTYRRGR